VWHAASVLAQTQTADPDRLAAIESMIADVNQWGRSETAFGRSDPPRNTDNQMRLSDVAGAFRRLCGR
jgi:hypothetical protein